MFQLKYIRDFLFSLLFLHTVHVWTFLHFPSPVLASLLRLGYCLLLGRIPGWVLAFELDKTLGENTCT